MLPRQIYEVHKKALGASVGGYVPMTSGYPKVFDSKNYDNDIDATLIAATGAFATAWSEICATAKNRDLQTVMLMTANGFVIDKKTIGEIPGVPEPEPESENPEPETPEGE